MHAGSTAPSWRETFQHFEIDVFARCVHIYIPITAKKWPVSFYRINFRGSRSLVLPSPVSKSATKKSGILQFYVIDIPHVDTKNSAYPFHIQQSNGMNYNHICMFPI